MPDTELRYDLSFTQNRELSWLRFNMRVLEEAADTSVPLLERLKFIAIFTSNLDEFFMVRAGSLLDLTHLAPDESENKSGRTPGQQLGMIYEAVRPMISRRDQVYAELSRELEAHDIRDISYEALSEAQTAFVKNYYKEKIKPLLSPQIIDQRHPFPHLKNKALYVAALLKHKNREMLGIVPVPETVPDILMMPDEPGCFIRTENILLHNLKKIFDIYSVKEQAVICVTRNADLIYDDEELDDDSLDIRAQMTRLLKTRDRLAPVRLEVCGEADGLCGLLKERLKLTSEQCFACSCPLVLKYAYKLRSDDLKLSYPAYRPVYPKYLDKNVSMWEQINQRDVLLFYPYHSMQPFLDLLKEAARDPRVVSIHITIYRLAGNSAVIKYLCEAAENGKEVTALIELRARFDENNNINWSGTLEESGCRVIYGMEGFKCHSKICLITRQDKNQLSYVTQIGTGNYNEKTAAQYTDFSLMTADREIAMDAVAFFQNMMIGNVDGDYSKLLVAPVSMKTGLLKLIDGEIQKGASGRIVIKANSVTERALIDKLSEASRAGVKINLIIRGICCLVPGIPGKTDNITVTSIVGRFLEHSRIYAFGSGEDTVLYISSADMMTRNQVRRVEIACPVESAELKKWFISYLDLLLKDNVKSRRMLSDGSYVLSAGGSESLSAQDYYLEHDIRLSPTVIPEKPIRSWFKKVLRRA